ncbi:hypothetical protein CsatA_025543 [Cannabis sativa]
MANLFSCTFHCLILHVHLLFSVVFPLLYLLFLALTGFWDNSQFMLFLSIYVCMCGIIFQSNV